MARTVGTWPLGYEQSLAGIERSRDTDKRILAIRSSRYYIESAGDDTQLSKNMRIFETFSTLLYQYRKRFDAAVSQGGDAISLAENISNNPLIREIGSVLRHALAKPQPDIGCFDHPLVWCMDFLDLQQCNFPRARLEQSSFYRTELGQTNFTYANLTGIDLTDADLSSADLSHVILSGAKLNDVNMAWANLSHAAMQGVFANNANLSGAILNHAVLADAFLSGANMVKASLIGTDLRDANMFAVQLHEAKLENTILTGTGITIERIERIGEIAQWNAGTRWGNDVDCDRRNPLHHDYY